MTDKEELGNNTAQWWQTSAAASTVEWEYSVNLQDHDCLDLF